MFDLVKIKILILKNWQYRTNVQYVTMNDERVFMTDAKYTFAQMLLEALTQLRSPMLFVVLFLHKPMNGINSLLKK